MVVIGGVGAGAVDYVSQKISKIRGAEAVPGDGGHILSKDSNMNMPFTWPLHTP